MVPRDESRTLIVGTPGGSRIISMVLLGLLEHIAHEDVGIDGVVALPRFHHQYLPDRIQVEPDLFDEAFLSALRDKGHVVEVYRRKWGNMQAVFRDARDGSVYVANDPRGREGVVF